MNYLHCHSDFSNSALSFRDSTIKVKDGVHHAFKMGATVATITDHECLSGTVKHWNEVEKIRNKGKKLFTQSPSLENKRMMNFKAILGNEIYVTKEGLNAETWQAGDRFYHLILLAKNRKGWEQLNELSTRAWSRMFRRAVLRKPTYLSDIQEVIGRNPGNVICTTACLGNILGEKILEFHKTRDKEIRQYIFDYINYMKSIFNDDFYLEIQPNKYSKDQKIYSSWLKVFGEYTNTKLVVATDTHYLKKEDREIHAAFLQSDPSSDREVEEFYATTYFLTVDEVREHLLANENFTNEDINNAILTTHEIAAKCEYYDIDSPIDVPAIDTRIKGWEKNIHEFDHLPMFKQFSHSEYEIDKYFVYKIITKYKDKLNKGLIEGSKKEFDRMEHELDVFWHNSNKINQRISNYFNTMEEMLEKIWEVSVIGVGRGSAGASFINFILDITQINPLTTPVELPFWRLMNKSRAELPDIDYLIVHYYSNIIIVPL